MGMTEKKRKKLTKWVRIARTKQNAILLDMVCQYFIVFCGTLFWDRIARTLQFKCEPGIGWFQITICIVCIWQMRKLSKMIER